MHARRLRAWSALYYAPKRAAEAVDNGGTAAGTADAAGTKETGPLHNSVQRPMQEDVSAPVDPARGERTSSAMSKAEPKNMYDSGDQEKDDRNFLSYVQLHSMTERALFHASHILYLFQLAGYDISEAAYGPNEFRAMHYHDIDDILAEATKRVNEKYSVGSTDS